MGKDLMKRTLGLTKRFLDVDRELGDQERQEKMKVRELGIKAMKEKNEQLMDQAELGLLLLEDKLKRQQMERDKKQDERGDIEWTQKQEDRTYKTGSLPAPEKMKAAAETKLDKSMEPEPTWGAAPAGMAGQDLARTDVAGNVVDYDRAPQPRQEKEETKVVPPKVSNAPGMLPDGQFIQDSIDYYMQVMNDPETDKVDKRNAARQIAELNAKANKELADRRSTRDKALVAYEKIRAYIVKSLSQQEYEKPSSLEGGRIMPPDQSMNARDLQKKLGISESEMKAIGLDKLATISFQDLKDAQTRLERVLFKGGTPPDTQTSEQESGEIAAEIADAVAVYRESGEEVDYEEIKRYLIEGAGYDPELVNKILVTKRR